MTSVAAGSRRNPPPPPSSISNQNIGLDESFDFMVQRTRILLGGKDAVVSSPSDGGAATSGGNTTAAAVGESPTTPELMAMQRNMSQHEKENKDLEQKLAVSNAELDALRANQQQQRKNKQGASRPPILAPIPTPKKDGGGEPLSATTTTGGGALPFQRFLTNNEFDRSYTSLGTAGGGGGGALLPPKSSSNNLESTVTLLQGEEEQELYSELVGVDTAHGAQAAIDRYEIQGGGGGSNSRANSTAAAPGAIRDQPERPASKNNKYKRHTSSPLPQDPSFDFSSPPAPPPPALQGRRPPHHPPGGLQAPPRTPKQPQHQPLASPALTPIRQEQEDDNAAARTGDKYQPTLSYYPATGAPLSHQGAATSNISPNAYGSRSNQQHASSPQQGLMSRRNLSPGRNDDLGFKKQYFNGGTGNQPYSSRGSSSSPVKKRNDPLLDPEQFRSKVKVVSDGVALGGLMAPAKTPLAKKSRDDDDDDIPGGKRSSPTRGKKGEQEGNYLLNAEPDADPIGAYLLPSSSSKTSASNTRRDTTKTSRLPESVTNTGTTSATTTGTHTTTTTNDGYGSDSSVLRRMSRSDEDSDRNSVVAASTDEDEDTGSERVTGMSKVSTYSPGKAHRRRHRGQHNGSSPKSSGGRKKPDLKESDTAAVASGGAGKVAETAASPSSKKGTTTTTSSSPTKASSAGHGRTASREQQQKPAASVSHQQQQQHINGGDGNGATGGALPADVGGDYFFASPLARQQSVPGTGGYYPLPQNFTNPNPYALQHQGPLTYHGQPNLPGSSNVGGGGGQQYHHQPPPSATTMLLPPKSRPNSFRQQQQQQQEQEDSDDDSSGSYTYSYTSNWTESDSEDDDDENEELPLGRKQLTGSSRGNNNNTTTTGSSNNKKQQGLGKNTTVVGTQHTKTTRVSPSRTANRAALPQKKQHHHHHHHHDGGATNNNNKKFMQTGIIGAPNTRPANNNTNSSFYNPHAQPAQSALRPSVTFRDPSSFHNQRPLPAVPLVPAPEIIPPVEFKKILLGEWLPRHPSQSPHRSREVSTAKAPTPEPEPVEEEPPVVPEDVEVVEEEPQQQPEDQNTEEEEQKVPARGCCA